MGGQASKPPVNVKPRLNECARGQEMLTSVSDVGKVPRLPGPGAEASEEKTQREWGRQL